MIDTSVVVAVVGIFGTVCAVVFGYAIFRRNARLDHELNAKQDGTMLTELGYIKSGIDDIKRKQEKQDERYYNIVERMTIVESAVKQAHKRIDRLDESSRMTE